MQAGPMMPPAETIGDASGPKFPSKDGSETRAGEDFFGNLSGVEGGAVDDQEASSSSPALNESGGESDCVHVSQNSVWCFPHTLYQFSPSINFPFRYWRQETPCLKFPEQRHFWWHMLGSIFEPVTDNAFFCM